MCQKYPNSLHLARAISVQDYSQEIPSSRLTEHRMPLIGDLVLIEVGRLFLYYQSKIGPLHLQCMQEAVQKAVLSYFGSVQRCKLSDDGLAVRLEELVRLLAFVHFKEHFISLSSSVHLYTLL